MASHLAGGAMTQRHSSPNSPAAVLRGLAAVLLLAVPVVPALAQGAPPILWDGAGHLGVNAVAISPDGQTLASVSQSDETLKLWRASDGELLRTVTGSI